MSESFDPYYHWLGISPKNQPPDHYRLLGVERFESHPDVIAAAADQRITHVRTFQSGPRGKHSQKLLNELAAARITLLDPIKRAAYDAAQRKQIVQQSRTTASRGALNDTPAASSAPAASPDNKTSRPVVEPEVGPADLASSVGDAARLLAWEVSRLWLEHVRFPAAFCALGEQVYAEGRLRDELPNEFAALEALDRAAREREAKSKPKPKPNPNPADAASANASGAAGAALAARPRQAATSRRAILLRALGAAAWRKTGPQAAPPGERERLETLAEELAALEADIARVERARPGHVLTPRWLAIWIGSLSAAIVLVLVGIPLRFAALVLIAPPLGFGVRRLIAKSHASKNGE